MDARLLFLKHLRSDGLEAIEGLRRVEVIARHDGLRAVNQFLVQLVVIVGQVGLLHIIRFNHLHKTFHLFLDHSINFRLGSTGVLDDLVEAFLQVLNLLTKGFSVHILPKELHHTLKAEGNENLIVPFLN